MSNPNLRRMPRPRGARRDWREPPGWRGAEALHPAVLEVAKIIRATGELAGLSPLVVLSDWFGMAEAAFKYRADNLRAIATSGQFVTDPPEVAEHFRRARERYLHATQARPAVYRVMQEGFARATALLSQAAAPGLAWFTQQELNPDLTGQVFMTLLNPGPAWAQFFPPWFIAQEMARARCPDPWEALNQVFIKAALAQRESGAPRVELEPGVNWAEWYRSVRPYFVPALIGPALIDSGAAMLAVAARFPDWAVRHGLVCFIWAGEMEPLLRQMANLNAMLFGLNRYDLDLLETELELEAYLETQPAPPPPPEHQVYLAAPEEEPAPAPDGATFEALFRQRRAA
jgi:hypothetical protein